MRPQPAHCHGHRYSHHWTLGVIPTTPECSFYIALLLHSTHSDSKSWDGHLHKAQFLNFKRKSTMWPFYIMVCGSCLENSHKCMEVVWKMCHLPYIQIKASYINNSFIFCSIENSLCICLCPVKLWNNSPLKPSGSSTFYQ